MVTTAEALSVLFPEASPLRDYVVGDDGSGARIVAWHLPAPQPTAEQIAAVTDAQVTAARKARDPHRWGLLDEAQQALADNQAFIDLGASPTAAQVRDQVRAITRQMQRVLHQLVRLSGG